MARPIRLAELNKQEFERIEKREAPSVPGSPPAEASAFDALAQMIGAEESVDSATNTASPDLPGSADATLEIDAQDQSSRAPQHEKAEAHASEVPFEAARPSSEEPKTATAGGLLSRSRQRNEAKRAAHRSTLDTLNLLRCLAPLFRAAELLPGPGASAQNIARAIRTMSEASVGLAAEIARRADHLELDTAWSLKTLQNFTAEIVADHWVQTVLAKGGHVDMPSVSAERFLPAIETVLGLSVDLSGVTKPLDLSGTGAVQLSLMKAMTPLTIEIDRLARVVNTRAGATLVDAGGITQDLSQFLVEQAISQQKRIAAENPEATDDDLTSVLQAMINHAASAMKVAWEEYRGRLLGAIAESSAQEAAELLSGPDMKYGFPLDGVKQRTAETVNRIVGTVLHAMKLSHLSAGNEQRV